MKAKKVEPIWYMTEDEVSGQGGNSRLFVYATNRTSYIDKDNPYYIEIDYETNEDLVTDTTTFVCIVEAGRSESSTGTQTAVYLARNTTLQAGKHQYRGYVNAYRNHIAIRQWGIGLWYTPSTFNIKITKFNVYKL